MKLKGLHAVVTGASQGLGYAIAREFLKEGCNVAICARDDQRLEEAAGKLRREFPEGPRVLARPCDVTQEREVEGLFAETMSEFGSLDAVVNNAGIVGPTGPFECVDWNAWKQVMEVDFHAAVLCCRQAVPHFKARNRGKIVNISGGGAASPRPNFAAYGAAKAALVRFTESAALELGDWGIDINVIAPGALNTRMLDQVLAAGPERVGPEYEKALKQKQTGGQSPDRAAKLCAFLVSKASDGITGRLISAVWDPWERLAERKEVLRKGDIYTLRRIVPQDRGEDWG